MIARFSVLFLMLADVAVAHPGHLIDVAGHDHWVAGAAIAIAIGLGIREAIKGKRHEAESGEKKQDEEELQEA